LVDVILVVRDENALPLALEEARLAHEALRSEYCERLLGPELELGAHRGVVHDVRHLVAGAKLEHIDRTDVLAVRAARALRNVDVDLDHPRCTEMGGLLAVPLEKER
jgi:hypothetical protein